MYCDVEKKASHPKLDDYLPKSFTPDKIERQISHIDLEGNDM
jgi:two-component SAPR family response regulator